MMTYVPMSQLVNVFSPRRRTDYFTQLQPEILNLYLPLIRELTKETNHQPTALSNLINNQLRGT